MKRMVSKFTYSFPNLEISFILQRNYCTVKTSNLDFIKLLVLMHIWLLILRIDLILSNNNEHMGSANDFVNAKVLGVVAQAVISFSFS